MKLYRTCLVVLLAIAPAGCHSGGPEAAPETKYDVIIRHGHILDGTGNPWYAGDIAIRGDRIAAIGSLETAKATRVIDATGRARVTRVHRHARPIGGLASRRQPLRIEQAGAGYHQRDHRRGWIRLLPKMPRPSRR